MSENEFKISTDVSLPAPKRGPSEKYPFDQLPAPVAVKDKNGKPVMDENGKPVMAYASFPVGKVAKSMTSTVYSATRRYTSDKKDDKGNVVKDKDGKPEVVKEREFRVYDVDPTTDKDNAVSRVFRIK